MKKIICSCIIIIVVLSILFPIVIATGDLMVELGEPQLLPKDGYGEQVFLPYKIKNVGNQPITSRFSVRNLHQGGRQGGWGAPLYIYSGELKEAGKQPLKKAPIEKSDGTIYWQDISTTQIKVGNGIIPNAPAVTLQPGESLLFNDHNLIGGMATFNFYTSGSYEIGYFVDPLEEVPEADETNNKATTIVDVNVLNYIKGPTKYLEANQYWFYFPEKQGCVTLAVPEPTEICLITYGPLTATLSVDKQEITLYHFWEIWGFSKKYKNMEFVAADGFVVTYS